MELGYKPQLRWAESAASARKHRDVFMRNLKKVLPDGRLAGYAWKFEYSDQRFYHAHVIIFVDGRYADECPEIVSSLRQYWNETLTYGRGVFDDCGGTSASRFPGAGFLAADDPISRASLEQAIIDMTMPAFYIKHKFPGFRMFGKGGFPRRRVRNSSNRSTKTRSPVRPKAAAIRKPWPPVHHLHEFFGVRPRS
jgi:hypothetical protein